MNRIDVLAADGSQLGVTSKTIWGDSHQIGCGGAEASAITLCEEWTRRGDVVRFYNDPFEQGASPFEQLPVRAFNPKDSNRDILIVYRSPNTSAIGATGLRVWFSTDQVCGVKGVSFRDFAQHVNKVVTISPFHTQYFKDVHNIQTSIEIDLPVRVRDYEFDVEKSKHRVIFKSVPARGLEEMCRIWPLIVKRVPDMYLTILSDYRLWGCGAGDGGFRIKWIPRDNFQYLGAVPRAEMIQEELKCELNIYPSIYPELFCVSIAESMIAGAYPITTSIGALMTTNMGTIVQWDAHDARGDEMFADIVANTVNDPEFQTKRLEVQKKAIERFHPDNILKQWDEKVFSA